MLLYVFSAVVPRLDRGTQYSRGLSAQALPPLENWIARSAGRWHRMDVWQL